MRNFLKHNVFTYCMGAFAFVGLFLLVFFAKGDIVLAINRYANQSLDAFFVLFTEVGNGLVYLLVGLIMLFFSYKKTFEIMLVGLLLLISSFVLKHFVFPDFVRPTAYFSLEQFSHIMPDFTYAKHFSFPSGHSITIFGLATVLAYQTKKTLYHILLFCLACAVGFSRMYVLQHFFMDVYVGALLGFCIAVGGIYIAKSTTSFSEKGLKDLF